MKISIVLLTASVALGLSCSVHPTNDDPAPPEPTEARLYDFESAPHGQPPPGFKPALTGGGPPPQWEVQKAQAVSGEQVTAQLSDDSTNQRYPLLILDGFDGRDVDLSVKFKTISGEIDASGGLVFRYRDAGNYYVVRANALENNVVAYKTVAGKRSNIGVRGAGDAYGVKAQVPHQQWNSLRVVMRGALMEIYLNQRKLFEVENETFSDAGKVGLWTKADAVTQFDDLRVATLESPR